MKKSTMSFLLSAMVFMGCSKDPIEEFEGTTSKANTVNQNEFLTEVANPDAPGTVSEVFFAGNKIPVESFNGAYVYQGDIMLSPNMVSQQDVKLVYETGETPPAQKSVGTTSDRWPDNTVYYAISGNLEDQYRVYDAIEHWEAKTNLDFVERSNQPNYIYFATGSGCSSYIGMIGGKQKISVSPSCSTGNIIHEIGHSVGLWHEQMRVDRNSYITINYENIEDGMEYNFKTYAEQGYDGAEFTSSLDFNSVMLYGSYAFSKNGEPTIVRKNGDPYRAQRDGLSSGDIEGINSIYPAAEGGEVPEPTYESGQIYFISGVSVLRYENRWFFSTRYGWRWVYLKGDYWWYK